LPEVDFKSNIVVAVFMGEKKTVGYGICISKIEESANNIYVELEETQPSGGADVAQRLTQPYHIVVVGKE